MKKSHISIVISLIFGAFAFADGGGDNQDWAEKAALEYEAKAAGEEAKGNKHDASIYRKMARMKRDAGAAAKAGRDYNWDEYHRLNGQLGGGKKDKHHNGKEHKAKDKSWNNKDGGKTTKKEKDHKVADKNKKKSEPEYEAE